MLPENVTHFSDFDSFDRTVICDDFDMAAGGAGRHTALLAETQCVFNIVIRHEGEVNIDKTK